MEKKKYNFSHEQYFSIPIDKLSSDKSRPFPLFIYLEQNDHLILIRFAGDELPHEKLQFYKQKKLESFWSLKEFQNEWLKYLDENPNTNGNPLPEQKTYEARSLEAALAVDALTAKELSDEQKKEVLKSVSSGMMSSLSTIKDPAQFQETFKKFQEFTEDVVQTALESHEMESVYDQIKKLTELDHSVVTSSMSVMFALGIGYSDKDFLANLSIGALMHDVGFIELPTNLLTVPETKMTPEQFAVYRSHVQKGVDLVQKNKIPITTQVKEIILQHHEKFDGTGYPLGLKGFKLSEHSQLVSIADRFGLFMNGLYDGVERPPDAALQALKQFDSGSTPRYYSPELFLTVMQLIEDSRQQSTQTKK